VSRVQCYIITKFRNTLDFWRKNNQIGHILVDPRQQSSIYDVQTLRRADCDTHHYMVVATCTEIGKWMSNSKVWYAGILTHKAKWWRWRNSKAVLLHTMQVLRGERQYSSYSCLTSALDGVHGQRHAPATLYPTERTRYLLDRSLGGPLSWPEHRG
jgi:hypothetical protein